MQLINKNELIDTLEKIPCWDCDGPCIDECYSCIIERVLKAPIIDAVPIVRCKDCKNRGTESCYLYIYDAGYNEFGEDYVYVEDKTKDDFFCAEGKQEKVQK